jgi:hypothetical protein
VEVLRILTENDTVAPQPVLTIRNVAPGKVLRPGVIIDDWCRRFIAVNPDLAQPLRGAPGAFEVTGHTFTVTWPPDCHQITAWQRDSREWVLPLGYTFRVTERLAGGSDTAQHWAVLAIPPPARPPTPPKQALTKPDHVPDATLRAIRGLVADDLARHHHSYFGPANPIAPADVYESFEYARNIMTIPRLQAAELPRTFGYYPHIEDFFDISEFSTTPAEPFVDMPP